MPLQAGKERFPRVQWRIMLRELPLLLVLCVCILMWLDQQQRAELDAYDTELARLSAAVTVSAVEKAMTTQPSEPSDPAHRVWNQLAEHLALDESVSIQIVDAQGVVVHSTDPHTEHQDYCITDTACTLCHEGGSEEATTKSLYHEGADDTRVRLYAASLGNAEECHTCHASDGVKLGTIYVEHPLQRTERFISRTRNGLIAAVVLAYLVSLLITGLVTRRYIDRPLKYLLRGAREIGAGNLDSTVELPERSELSVLADAFNHSTRQLKESIQEIEYQRDDLRTLYYIADQLGQRVEPEERRRRAVELVGTIFESDCFLIAGHFHHESRMFDGTLTYLDEHSQIVEVPFGDPDDLPEISFYAPTIVDRWMAGDLDGHLMIRDGANVGYPLERRNRRLGLIIAPALPPSAFRDGRPTAANPRVVKAFAKHLALALDLSELRREYLQQGRLAAVGAVVAGLSHCLKNTLNGLRGGVYVVDRAMESNNPDRLEQGWKVLTSSVQQIERLSLDMLYFSRAHQPKLTLIDPNRILKEIVALLTRSSADQGVEVRADLDVDIGKVHLDRLSIYRVVLNLATNAVDACVESPDGGDLVVIRSRSTDDEVLISVEDNGVGMSEITRKRMYEQFFSTKLGRGTGLGLPVVKKILEEQGGALEVESTLGRGSTFTIRLPRITALD